MLLLQQLLLLLVMVCLTLSILCAGMQLLEAAQTPLAAIRKRLRAYSRTCNTARRDWLKLRTLTAAAPVAAAPPAGKRSGLRKSTSNNGGSEKGEADGAVGVLRDFVVELETELAAMQSEFCTCQSCLAHNPAQLSVLPVPFSTAIAPCRVL